MSLSHAMIQAINQATSLLREEIEELTGHRNMLQETVTRLRGRLAQEGDISAKLDEEISRLDEFLRNYRDNITVVTKSCKEQEKKHTNLIANREGLAKGRKKLEDLYTPVKERAGFYAKDEHGIVSVEDCRRLYNEIKSRQVSQGMNRGMGGVPGDFRGKAACKEASPIGAPGDDAVFNEEEQRLIAKFITRQETELSAHISTLTEECSKLRDRIKNVEVDLLELSQSNRSKNKELEEKKSEMEKAREEFEIKLKKYKKNEIRNNGLRCKVVADIATFEAMTKEMFKTHSNNLMQQSHRKVFELRKKMTEGEDEAASDGVLDEAASDDVLEEFLEAIKRVENNQSDPRNRACVYFEKKLIEMSNIKKQFAPVKVMVPLGKLQPLPSDIQFPHDDIPITDGIPANVQKLLGLMKFLVNDFPEKIKRLASPGCPGGSSDIKLFYKAGEDVKNRLIYLTEREIIQALGVDRCESAFHIMPGELDELIESIINLRNFFAAAFVILDDRIEVYHVLDEAVRALKQTSKQDIKEHCPDRLEFLEDEDAESHRLGVRLEEGVRKLAASLVELHKSVSEKPLASQACEEALIKLCEFSKGNSALEKVSVFFSMDEFINKNLITKCRLIGTGKVASVIDDVKNFLPPDMQKDLDPKKTYFLADAEKFLQSYLKSIGEQQDRAASVKAIVGGAGLLSSGGVGSSGASTSDSDFCGAPAAP